MWRLGFALWAIWQVVRWAVVGAVALVVLYLWGGFNGAFVLAVVGVVVGLWALRRTLRELYARESVERR